MPVQLFKNNASSTMSGSLSQGGTTMILSAGTGSKFPAPTGGDYFLLTLYEKDVSANEEMYEIVKVTARTADTLTIVRDFENVVGVAGGRAYPTVGGRTVYCELRWTAGATDNLLQDGDIGVTVQAYDADLTTLSDVSAATDKATPVDADLLPLADSAATFGFKKLTWANLKATIKTYYDSVAATLTNKTLNLSSNTLSGTKAQFDAALSDDNFGYVGTANTWTLAQTFGANIAFTGTGNRITGDFSNATIGSRVMFQTSTANTFTQVHAIPNGTGTAATWTLHNSSDTTNYAFTRLLISSTESSIQTDKNGTGSYLPWKVYVGGAERLQIDTSGNLSVTGNYVSFGGNGYIRCDAANTLQFQCGSSGYVFKDSANSASLATLNASGNLGLGVTPSAGWANGWRALQCQYGAMSASGTGTYTSTQVSDNAYFNGSGANLTTASYIGSSIPATNYKQYNGTHAWYTAPSGTAGNAITWLSQMTLDTNGRLGVGSGISLSAWGSGSNPAVIEFPNGGSIHNWAALQMSMSANTYFNGTSWIAKSTAPGSYYQLSGGAHYWYTMAQVTAGLAQTLVTQAVLSPTNGMNFYTGVHEYKVAPAISAGVLTIDCGGSNVVATSLNANITSFTLQNIPGVGLVHSFILELTADGTARTITWTFQGVSVKWAGGTAPTLTSTNGKKDAFSFYTYDAGATWIGSVIGQNF